MILTGFPTPTISSKEEDANKSMPDLCQDDPNSSDVEDDTRAYLQLCFAIGEDDDVTGWDEETNNKSQQLVELSQTEEVYRHHGEATVPTTITPSSRKPFSLSLTANQDGKDVKAEEPSEGVRARCFSSENGGFRANLRKSKSVSLLAVECSSSSSFFDFDKSGCTEDSDESDDECSLRSKSNKGEKNNFLHNTSTHSTSSAGSVSHSIVQLRRKLKDRSATTRRPMWSSSLTSSMTSTDPKKRDNEGADDDESCDEHRSSNRSRMSSAKSCADIDKRSKRASKSSATCAGADPPTRARTSSSASVQVPPSTEFESVPRSRQSSGSSVQGIMSFVSEATSSHRRSPPSAQKTRSSLLARLPTSRTGRRSSASSDAGDVDPPLLGADSMSCRGSGRRSCNNSSTSSILFAAKEEIHQRNRKADSSSSTMRERRFLSTMQ